MRPDDSDPAAADRIETSRRFGRYRVLERIAAGGMGTVYRAEERLADGRRREVALKLLHAHHSSEDSEIKMRFLDEGRLASRIVHPNVVPVFEVGEQDGSVYLALDYVPGTTLGALLKECEGRGEATPLPIVSAIAIDFLSGLQAAHELGNERGEPLGVVHRDVSPQNVLVGLDGRGYVTDFGIAKVKDRIRTTRSGLMLGKAGYMAPEQVLCREVSARTDLYAAGVVLWESLAGRRLYRGLEAQMQAATLPQEVPSLTAVRQDVPVELDRLVHELLQPDAAQRPAHAFDVVLRLRRIVPPAPPEEVAAWVREHRAADTARAALLPELADLPTQVDIEVDIDSAPSTLLAPAAPPAPPTGRRVSMRAAAAPALLVLALGLGVAGWASGEAEPSRVARPATRHRAAEPPRAPAPEVGALPSAQPASRPPPPAPAPPVRKLPRRAPACDPPYVIENGVRRYKTQCFRGGR